MIVQATGRKPILSMRHVVHWYALSLFLLVPSLASAQQHLLVAEESTSAAAYRSQIGRVVTFICPANVATNREIWGTDVYLVDSPVCTAAAHAGVFTPGVSGQVTIVMGPGAASFEGGGRNGVKSSSYGPGESTYSFKNGETGQIDWITTLERVPDDFRVPLTLLCPPKGQADAYVWGTDVYTSSSALCVAAVHAGVITLDAGGRVAVTLMPKQETFVPSLRNGITTKGWKNWDFMSYGQPYKITLASSSSGSGPRTIKISGFTAAGSSATVVPRTIQTAGFMGAGAAPVVVPRSIRVDGWTGTGTVKKTLRR